MGERLEGQKEMEPPVSKNLICNKEYKFSQGIFQVLKNFLMYMEERTVPTAQI